MIELKLQVDGRTGRSTDHRLDGTSYKIEVFWIASEAIWSLSMAEDDGTALPVQGRTMRHGADLLRSISDPRLPPGALVVWDTSNRQQDPGRNDLDSDGGVRLMYVTGAELVAAGIAS